MSPSLSGHSPLTPPGDVVGLIIQRDAGGVKKNIDLRFTSRVIVGIVGGQPLGGSGLKQGGVGGNEDQSRLAGKD